MQHETAVLIPKACLNAPLTERKQPLCRIKVVAGPGKFNPLRLHPMWGKWTFCQSMLIDFTFRHWPPPPPSFHKRSRPLDSHCNFSGHLISYLLHNKSIVISKKGGPSCFGGVGVMKGRRRKEKEGRACVSKLHPFTSMSAASFFCFLLVWTLEKIHPPLWFKLCLFCSLSTIQSLQLSAHIDNFLLDYKHATFTKNVFSLNIPHFSQ